MNLINLSVVLFLCLFIYASILLWNKCVTNSIIKASIPFEIETPCEFEFYDTYTPPLKKGVKVKVHFTNTDGKVKVFSSLSQASKETGYAIVGIKENISKQTNLLVTFKQIKF